MKKELSRKSVHMTLGALLIVPLVLLSFIEFVFFMFFSIVVSALFFLAVEKKLVPEVVSRFVGFFERENHHAGKGALLFLSGVFLSSLLVLWFVSFEKAQLIIAAAIISLSIGDTFAAVFGRMFGKTRLFGSRTLEGSLAFFVSVFSVVLVLFDFSFAVVCAVAGSLTELLVEEDNLLIPLFISLLLIFV